MITCTLRDKKYTIDFVSSRALRELEPTAQMYAKVVHLSELAANRETIPEDAKFTISDAMDEMDMQGFLKIRAWNARREKQRHEPRRRFIDEIWSDVKPC